MVLSSVGFSQEMFLQDSIVAKVGNIEITVDEFVSCYEYGPAFYKRVKNSKNTFLNYLINEKLLALDGYNRHLDTLSWSKRFWNFEFV